jgi:hypothetical protein
MRFFGTPLPRLDYPNKDYDSLVTALEFRRDAGIFRRFLTFYTFRRHQAGFGTEHLKNDIREYRYPGKPTRPDSTRWKPFFRCTYQSEKSVSVPQPFHFLHQAASASGRFFRSWWDPRRCITSKTDTKQACVLAHQSFLQQRHCRGKTWVPTKVYSLQRLDLWLTLRQGQKGSLTETIVTQIKL